MENDAWATGTVERMDVEHEGGTAPFAVKLDRGDTVIAPVDDDRYIRAEGARATTANDVSARLLRFAVGARVECNLGMYWERGRVVKLNYHDPRDLSAPPVPYEVELDSGGLVSAPQDDDQVIRREGSIQMSDAGLRFGVGDRIDWNLSPTVAAPITYGCSLPYLRLQPPSPTVAASITHGCSLHRLRLQASASSGRGWMTTAAVDGRRVAWWRCATTSRSLARA